MKHNGQTTQLKQLTKEREHTLLRLAHLRESLKSEIDRDMDDGANDIEEHDNIMTLIMETERKLRSIEHALQSAQQGAYGICERCGQPIDPARLEALPEATFCMPCKTIVERHTRQKPVAVWYD